MELWDALLIILYRLGSICVIIAIGLLLNKMTQEKRHKDAKGSIRGNSILFIKKPLVFSGRNNIQKQF